MVMRGPAILFPPTAAYNDSHVVSEGPSRRGDAAVEAAGVEREFGAIGNFLMARDFWG